MCFSYVNFLYGWGGLTVMRGTATGRGYVVPPTRSAEAFAMI